VLKLIRKNAKECLRMEIIAVLDAETGGDSSVC